MAAVWLLHVLRPGTQPFVPFQIIDLLPNQLGHMLFASFGGFLGYLGGPVVQVAFPLSLSCYLFASRKLFFVSLTLFWAAQSLFDVALYAKDARALTFVLIGGPDHTWNVILSRLDLLELDQFIGTLIYLSGVFTLFVALTVGLLAARKSTP